MNDALGDRMKEKYEDRTRYFLPRRTFTIIRVDGKAFHSYTKTFERPFDRNISNVMDSTAISLCEAIQGAQLGYVQSDEISILITDFANIQTEAWFNGNLQKMVSVAASIATAEFNQAIYRAGIQKLEPATFDARAFTIPDREEVLNYFIWRQQDASRNSVQMVAQSLYPHKELQGKNNFELQEMIHQKGLNWNDIYPRDKRGACIIKTPPQAFELGRHRVGNWYCDHETPIFTKNRSYLNQRVTVHGYCSDSGTDNQGAGDNIKQPEVGS
jgi:tRNA(His) guanylyltransferase